MNIEQLAEKIRFAGYEVIFGIVGSGPSYKLIKALVDQGLTYFPVSSESAAAIAAGSFSYYNRRKAIAISIKGPGFINLLSGVAACFLENFDMLAISEEYATNSPLELRHKRIDQQILLKEVCQRRASLLSHSTDSFFLDSVYAPGPKYFSLSELKLDDISNFPKEIEMSKSDFYEILKKISSATRPLLIVGSLIYRLNFEDELDTLNIPILTSVQAKGVIDENNKNAFGVYTGVGKGLVPENELIEHADLVVSIGLKNEEILGIAAKKRFLNLGLCQDAFDPYTLACSILQIKSVLSILNSKKEWTIELKKKYKALMEGYIFSKPWLPAKIFHVINNFQKPSTLVLDTGFFCTVGEHVYLASRNKRFIGSSNARNMGLSVPMTLGVGLKNDIVFCCFGDGGIRYHIGEIRTIVELNLKVCFILISDGKYGSVDCYVGNEIFDTKLVHPLGTTWFQVMKGMGMPSFFVQNEEEFTVVLSNWDGNCPMFIEAYFDPTNYLKMTQNLRI